MQREMFETKCDLVVLGLDLSLNGTGGAVIEPDGSTGVAFTAGRKLKESASPKERIHRLIDIWRSIWNLAFVRRRDQKLQVPQLV